MERRQLGNSGLRVSLAGLGCNNFGLRTDLEQSRAIVHKALDCGIDIFDTADSYGNRGGSEEILGAALGPRRKDAIIATKFGNRMDDAGRMMGASRQYVTQAVEASLRRLRTDWIDLYQLHFPDPHTPVEETLCCLDDLVRQGKVRYIGVSNMSAWQIVDAVWTARHHGLGGIVSTQTEYNLLSREPEQHLIPALESAAVSLLPYFPLANGLLTGKYRRNEAPAAGSRLSVNSQWAAHHLNDQKWTRIEALQTLAAERGLSLLQLAFGWLASRPVIGSVIAGATSPAQVEQNVESVSGLLEPDLLTEIDRTP